MTRISHVAAQVTSTLQTAKFRAWVRAKVPNWACYNSPGALIAAVQDYSTLLRGIYLQADMATASVSSSKRLTHRTNQKYLRASSNRRFAKSLARASRLPKLAVVVNVPQATIARLHATSISTPSRIPRTRRAPAPRQMRSNFSQSVR